MIYSFGALTRLFRCLVCELPAAEIHRELKLSRKIDSVVLKPQHESALLLANRIILSDFKSDYAPMNQIFSNQLISISFLKNSNRRSVSKASRSISLLIVKYKESVQSYCFDKIVESSEWKQLAKLPFPTLLSGRSAFCRRLPGVKTYRGWDSCDVPSKNSFAWFLKSEKTIDKLNNNWQLQGWPGISKGNHLKLLLSCDGIVKRWRK